MNLMDLLLICGIVLCGSFLCMIMIFLGITCINYLCKEKTSLEENLN
jgi:prolipoprotein diacylglyceryltransferase